MTINAYLKRCMTISLRRRAVWVLVGGVVGLVLGVLLGLNTTGQIFMVLLGAVAIALGVAINSYLRHSRDLEAQP